MRRHQEVVVVHREKTEGCALLNHGGANKSKGCIPCPKFLEGDFAALCSLQEVSCVSRSLGRHTLGYLRLCRIRLG